MLFGEIRELFARCGVCDVRCRWRAWRPFGRRQLTYSDESEQWLCADCLSRHGPWGPPPRGVSPKEWGRTLAEYKRLTRASGGA